MFIKLSPGCDDPSVVSQWQPVLHPGDGQSVLDLGQALQSGLTTDVDDLLGGDDIWRGNNFILNLEGLILWHR